LCLSFRNDAQTLQLWGVTSTSAANGNGSIIKINEDENSFGVAYSFVDSTGSYPQGNLVKAANGILYGMTNTGGANGEGVIFSFNLPGNTYTDVYDFNDSTGSNPYGNLLLASDGNFYGMTQFGGAKGYGVIFRFNTDFNTYSDIHDFNDTLGGLPFGSLIQVNDSELYGMTYQGGDTALNSGNGFGAIFSFNFYDSVYNVLYDFNFNNGAFPRGNLIKASNGIFYGMTAQGGVDSEGVIFSINVNNNFVKILHNFTTATGAVSFGSLLQAGNGMLYGMTYSGGAKNEGVIFSIDTLGVTYNDIHDFDTTNGANPYGSLIQASDGLLYGMTYNGGANFDGTLFSFNTGSNRFQKLFDLYDTTGTNPYDNLIELSVNTGINLLSANDFQFSIFPNPATDQLTVNSNLSVNKITIENVLGQIVIEKTVSPLSVIANEQLDVSNLPTGMYFITLIAQSQTITKKFLVVK
jgi:uncharacterized repeat protein (TIGR03803 family)